MDVGHPRLLTLRLQCLQSLKSCGNGLVKADFWFFDNPDLASCFRFRDSTSLEVFRVEWNGIVILQPCFIIVAGLLGSFADVAIIDKGADINVVSRLFQDLERLRGIAQRLDEWRWF